MPLRSMSFSDLILLPDGKGFLKGTAEGPCLVPVPEHVDLSILAARIQAERMQNNFPSRFRFVHEDITYRVAIYNDVVFGQAAFLRRMPEKVPDFDRLGLPLPLYTWLMGESQHKGLVLFAGPQASGKTTSAASYISARISRYGGHAVSFESPVEMPLAGPCGPHGFCFQGEADEEYLAERIKDSHRFASPDILYLGEVLGKEAAAQLLRSAIGSSRQIVVTSIHGLSVVAALDRLLAWGRETDGEAACHNLSQSLLAVIFQEIDHVSSREKPVLKVPQFLLVPFSDNSKGIRSKLREGRLGALEDNMREQRHKINAQGIGAI